MVSAAAWIPVANSCLPYALGISFLEVSNRIGEAEEIAVIFPVLLVISLQRRNKCTQRYLRSISTFKREENEKKRRKTVNVNMDTDSKWVCPPETGIYTQPEHETPSNVNWILRVSQSTMSAKSSGQHRGGLSEFLEVLGYLPSYNQATTWEILRRTGDMKVVQKGTRFCKGPMFTVHSFTTRVKHPRFIKGMRRKNFNFKSNQIQELLSLFFWWPSRQGSLSFNIILIWNILITSAICAIQEHVRRIFICSLIRVFNDQ